VELAGGSLGVLGVGTDVAGGLELGKGVGVVVLLETLSGSSLNS
jgi:hypothetical protein